MTLTDPVLASRTFGIYLGINGLAFFLAPGPMLAPLGLPAPTDEWIRLVGLLTLILSMYFIWTARPGERRFFQATVIARVMFFTGVLGLVLAGKMPALLSVFGVVDLAGAAWTQYALHHTRASAS